MFSYKRFEGNLFIVIHEKEKRKGQTEDEDVIV